MNKESKKKLLLYVESANKNISHPCDDDKFVDFIKTSHMVKDISVDTVKELKNILYGNHFSEFMIRNLVSGYEYGRLLLKSLNI